MSVGMVQTIVNGTHKDAVLPESCKKPMMLLNWSYKFNIPDLVIDEGAISGTLSFQNEDFHVTIPWGSVLSMYNANDQKGSRIDWPADD
jgi:hypothetical protein